MNRRQFLKTSGLGLAGLSFTIACQNRSDKSVQYIHPEILHQSNIEVPAGKRISFGWPAFAVPEPGQNGRPLFKWNLANPDQPARLRFTIALDVREEKIVEVRLADSGQRLGVLDIRFAPVLEPFELVVNQSMTTQLIRQGVELVMTKGTRPVWFFDLASGRGTDYKPLQPHLMVSLKADPVHQFKNRMASLASIQPYGWMEGCVLDGLYDLYQSTEERRYQQALTLHMSHFFRDDQTLVYENPRSEPRDGIIAGIESTLPNAVIAKLEFDHPVLDKVVDFWLRTQDSAGCVQDGNMTSAEGNYTIAYPMMVIGRKRKRYDLIHLAIEQLRLRQQRLIDGGDCYLRFYADGRRTYRNWARGVAWYMLGLVRTLAALELDVDVSALKAELQRIVAWVSGYQQPNGLWRCFLNEDIPVDTSGSAGIAAAIALAVKHGLLSQSHEHVPQKTLNGLTGYLTPDGFLTGVAQSNRGGEALQRSDYRVISQIGMGLMAQLSAAL